MNNILIPSEVASLPRSGLHYALHLMSGRKACFYLETLSLKQKSQDRQLYNQNQINSVENIVKREIKSLQKKINAFFPNENYVLRVLSSPEDLEENINQFSLTILNTKFKTFNDFFSIHGRLKILKIPFLVIPDEIYFTIPKKLLLIIEPGVKIKPSTLTPLKRIYGNHNFSLEIHKIYSGDMNVIQTTADKSKLQELFNIYHPVVRVFSGREYKSYYEDKGQENFDLQVLPHDPQVMARKMSNMGFSGFLSNLKTPTLIIPEIGNALVPEFERSRKRRNPSFLRS